MKTPRSALASELLSCPRMKWMGLGLAAWMLMGCLVPQDQNYLSERPIPRNRPPRILETQVQPSERIIRGYGLDRCELEFHAIVEDPDMADKLYTYWYVDYDPTDTRGADSQRSLEPTNNKTVRDERATFSSRVNSSNFNRLNIPGDHVVELVVSDRTLIDGREPEPTVHRLPDGTDVLDPGYATTYVWFVRTEVGGDCR